MPLQLPDRAHFDHAIDPERALVALDYASEPDRAVLVRLAEAAGLALETGLEQPAGATVGRSGKGTTIRIHQDVTVSVDGLELDGDDLVLKQELRIDAKAVGGTALARRRRRSDVAQSGRMIWLVGKDAVLRMRRAIDGKRFTRNVAVVPVYVLPNGDRSLARRYTADPWFVDISAKQVTVQGAQSSKKGETPEHGPLPPALEQLVSLVRGVPAVAGKWLLAKINRPKDLYDFAAEFLKVAGDRYRLAIRGIPMLVPLASIPIDPDYVSMQKSLLIHISAESMWTKVIASSATLTNVKIFYVDVGIFSPGQDIAIDTTLSVYINQLNPMNGYVHGVTPSTNNDHGTQMAGVCGAIWDTHGMAGIAGCFAPPTITQVSLRCTTLAEIGEAFAYAATTLSPGDKGVVVIGLDLLQLYLNATICMALTDENNRFNDALTTATTTNDLLVIAASGNYDPTVAVPDPAIHLVPTDLSGLVIVGATDQGCANRLVDLPNQVASKFGPGLTLVAPGGNVRTTSNTTLMPPLYTQGYGTSIAAAHVAGIAALTRSMHPGLNAAAVKAKLAAACAWTGFSPLAEVGSGLIDGALAVS
jgi:hypothetical protein